MLMEWLEPAINERVYQVTEICCNKESSRNSHGQFMEIIIKLKKEFPNASTDIQNEIECLLNYQIREVIETAYRSGLSDGLMLKL